MVTRGVISGGRGGDQARDLYKVKECGGYGPIAERCKANLRLWNAHSERSDSVGCACRGGSGLRRESRGGCVRHSSGLTAIGADRVGNDLAADGEDRGETDLVAGRSM